LHINRLKVSGISFGQPLSVAEHIIQGLRLDEISAGASLHPQNPVALAYKAAGYLFSSCFICDTVCALKCKNV